VKVPSLVLSLAMATALTVAPIDGAQQPVFRSSVDLVNVTVSVKQNGKPVDGLRPADFEVRDEGEVRPIVDLSRDTLPLDVTLALDMSASVTGAMQQLLERAVNEVGHSIRPGDRVRVVTFNYRVSQVRDFDSGSGPLDVHFGTPSGGTALFDAIVASIVTPADGDRRQMAIVFTDGEDTASFADEPMMIDAAARSATTIFAVTLAGGTRAAPNRTASERLFQALTNATGGALAVLQRDEDLGPSFVRAFDEFRTSYVLRVPATTVASKRSDGWHALSVKLTRSGRYEVRARPGYFAVTTPPS
jgi:VWFA-related protein